MGIFGWLFGQFIDVIEWKDDSQNTILWRFPRGDSEIKYGAKLIVRESQVAVFVDKGEIADVLTPGIYELETDNLPILTNLQHWDHGFESPFKAEVYFINTKLFSNQKWGTKNPILVRDSEFDMIRLRAFGTYEFRVSDPKKFIKEVSGTDGHFTTEEIEERLASLIVSNLAVTLGEDKRSILDLAASYDTFAKFMQDNLKKEFEDYGLNLEQILVENISLPEEVEQAIDKRSSRAAIGDLDEHLKYQGAESLANSSASSEMASLGAGIAMANEISKSFNSNSNTTTPAAATTPPPPPKTKLFYIVKEGKANGPHTIDALESMVNRGELTPNSYIWQEGWDGWKKMSEVLSNLFNTTPPPVPNE